MSRFSVGRKPRYSRQRNGTVYHVTLGLPLQLRVNKSVVVRTRCGLPLAFEKCRAVDVVFCALEALPPRFCPRGAGRSDSVPRGYQTAELLCFAPCRRNIPARRADPETFANGHPRWLRAVLIKILAFFFFFWIRTPQGRSRICQEDGRRLARSSLGNLDMNREVRAPAPNV